MNDTLKTNMTMQSFIDAFINSRKRIYNRIQKRKRIIFIQMILYSVIDIVLLILNIAKDMQYDVAIILFAVASFITIAIQDSRYKTYKNLYESEEGIGISISALLYCINNAGIVLTKDEKTELINACEQYAKISNPTI